MYSSDEEREALCEAVNDKTAIGATGKRLAFNMGGELKSQIQGLAPEEERERLNREKAEAAQLVAQAQTPSEPPRWFEVWGPRILVHPLKTPEVRNGVLIAESARYLTAEGIVREVGDGTVLPTGERIPPRAKVGDIVKYTPYSGSSFSFNGEDVLILSERDILGRVREEIGATQPEQP